MSLSLHNLKGAPKKSRKRLGRGNASGRGTYCTRGMKGQRSRSGGRRKARARQAFLKSLPKLKGFKSPQEKVAIIDLEDLNRHFQKGDLINPRILRKAGLIDKIDSGVKILGDGELKITDLKFEGVRFSKSAKAKAAKRGGVIL